MRIDRMLSIVVLLLNRRNITARELSERFEVSIRTVYRDIDAINEAGIPVLSTQGSNGGFSIVENYKLHHQLLTMDNTRAILTALKGIQTTLQDKEIELAMDKIRSLVPREKTDELDQQLDQLVIEYLPWGYGEEFQVKMQQINKAITTNQLLSIDYLSLKREEITRTVEPMTLIFKGYAWYLFAFCRLRNDGRLFRLSRIRSFKILDQTFYRRSISIKDFTKNGEIDQPMVDLILHFSPFVRLRVEEFFNKEQIKETKDKKLMVEVSFPEGEWVYSMILGFGENVEVIKPERIRSIIKDKVEKIKKLYQT